MPAKNDLVRNDSQIEEGAPVDKYQAAGDEYEDKLDRQKGDGHNKQAPSHQTKPKSVRN